MNKLLKNNLINHTLVAMVLVVLFVPQLAFAQASFLQETLWSVVNSVFGFFAWMGGQTLNYAVTNYVVGFGHNFLESGTGNSVDILWTVVRDIFNLTFIFGLVYIGLKMILDSSDSQARTMLVHLILAALLVNFSLFITKFVVDLSNVTAAQIAGAFRVENGVHGVSSSFMHILGFNDLFSTGSSLPKIAGSSAGYTYIFSTMFLYIILAFVFMSGGIMLIIRYIVLIIYMILSPIMFLGWVFPGFASVSRDYWRKFLGRAFFAPAYLLMLYFANQVLVSMQGANGINTGSYGAVFSGRVSTVGDNMGAVIPFFFMTAGFLIAALVVGQKMGAEGASTAISLGSRASGKARQYATNAATYVPRKVSGAAAGAVGRNTVGRLAASNGLARFNAKINNSKAGSIAAAAVGLSAKNRQAITEAGQNAKFGSSQSLNDVKKFETEQRKRDNEAGDVFARSKAFKANTEILEKNGANEEELTTALKGLSDSLKAMTNTEKSDLGISKLKDIKVAANLNDSDIEGFEKSGNFTSSQIQEIKTARDNGHAAIASSGTTITGNSNVSEAMKKSQRNSLVNKSVKDLGKMSTKVFTDVNMASYLTPQMLEERLKNGGLSNDDIKTIKNNIQSTATPQSKKIWQQWSERSTWGPIIDLNFPNEASTFKPTYTPPPKKSVIVDENGKPFETT